MGLDPGRTEPRSRRRRRSTAVDWIRRSSNPPHHRRERKGRGGRHAHRICAVVDWVGGRRRPAVDPRRRGGLGPPLRGSVPSRWVGAAPPWIRAGRAMPLLATVRGGVPVTRCSPPSSGICKGASVRGTRSTIDLREKKEGSTPCAGSAAAAGASMPASGPPRRLEEGEEGAPSGPPPPAEGGRGRGAVGASTAGRRRERKGRRRGGLTWSAWGEREWGGREADCA